MVVEASSVEDFIPKGVFKACGYAPGVLEGSRPN